MSLNNRISQKWINNIKKLDSKYELSHGAIYATDRSIQELAIDRNEVRAKVQGVPGNVYDVEIKFREFDDRDKESVLKLIKANPFIYSKFFKRQISEELIHSDVNLFPDSLDDFEMSCTCGKGPFCKHEAAVFHKISNEMAKNPFLLLSLRGVDFSEMTAHKSHDIKSISNLMNDESAYVLNDSGDINYLVRMNFLLEDFPSFYPSNSVNFNEIICDTLASMSRCIYQIHNSRVKNEFQELIFLGNALRDFEFFKSKTKIDIMDAFEGKWECPQRWDGVNIGLNGNYEISKIRTGHFTNNFFKSNLKYPLFAFLAEIDQVDLAFYCDDIIFLHDLYMFTSKLINMNALVPEFFRLDNGEYHVRWVPSFEKSIYDELEYFYMTCPRKLLTFRQGEVSSENQVNALISLIFEGFCQYYINSFIPRNLASFKNDAYFRLFFVKSQDLSNYSNGKEMEIDEWISVLFLNQNDYEYVLNTEQVEYHFLLKLKIRMNGKIHDFTDIVDLGCNDIIRNVSVIHNIFSKSNLSLSFLNGKTMNIRQYSYFMDNIAPVLRECGIEVNLPGEFRNAHDAKLVLNVNSSQPTSSLTLNDLVDFDWKVAIGDETFSLEDFESFSSSFRGLVKVKDRYVLLDEGNLNRLREDIASIPETEDKSEIIGYLLTIDEDNVKMDGKLEDLVNAMRNVRNVNVPETLNGKLREYQETGFSWMVQNMQLGFGSILADDMGLGKTIQVLSVILHLKQTNRLNNEKVLIVAPTSILTNWAMEIEKFSPSLKVEIYHGPNRHIPERDYDVLLTSYGVLRKDIEDFTKSKWFLIVADEAQNIKNPNSKKTKAVKAIKATHHIALSGTPIENHLSEYWSIFDFTNKGYLKSLKEFNKRFIKPIENQRDGEVLDEFKKITSPFIMRRLKTDRNIVRELPDKIINDVYCNLSIKQASMYDETLNQLINDVVKSEGIQRKGLVLKLINSLKQICNHPSHFLKIDEAKINESGKMEVLVNLLETILESDEKVLIFTQYVQMGKIMKRILEERFSQKVLFLHGGVHRNRRDRMIDEFQNGNVKIFILSLKAGGTGLNLTAASNVIHYDLWWNPAVENQATDRAYRIGQSENVMVYRFITKGTLEERINQILLEKRELLDLAIGGDKLFITEMSNDELREMLDLRKSRNIT